MAIDAERLRVLLEEEGKSHKEAAIILGHTRPAITKLANKLGYKRRHEAHKIDIITFQVAIADGMSFSEFGRVHGFNVGAVSRFAKQHNIVPPGTNHLPKCLPDTQLHAAYVAGQSLHQLHLAYKLPVATVKRHIRKVDPKIVFRTRDQAMRPALLNDPIALDLEGRTKSFRTIAKELGVKIRTVTMAARKFGIEFRHMYAWDDIEYHILLDQYLTKSLSPSAIASELRYPYAVVLRQLRKCGFPIARPGGEPRPSKYAQLNDAAWLSEQYAVRSANSIAIEVGAPVGMVFYHLRRHNIVIRTKEEYLQLIMDHVHGSRTTYRNIACHSQLEKQFLMTLPDSAQIERNVRLEAAGSYCLIDFKVDGQLIEVKPKEIRTQSGPDRRRMIKQVQICKHNNIQLRVWTPSGDWNGETDSDDVLYAMNWKLCFDTSQACAAWLLAGGFVPPKYGLLELADAAAKMCYCRPGQQLHAGFNNHNPLKLTAHFFPHYWSSTHKDYLPVSAAWQIGNQSVLRAAVSSLWDCKQEVNIYGLIKHIIRYFKDFAAVSWFKPWIAAYVYDRYLPNGGTVVDPSCGWGGRFMGAAGKPIRYIGSDLNKLSVESHHKLRQFLKGRVCVEPEFYVADASNCDFAEGDLLFTSPPYDDTESYHGVDSKVTRTKPIFDNIFRSFRGKIVLNVPRRMDEMCCTVASAHGRELVERMEMKTASFMGRTSTHEPILVFK